MISSEWLVNFRWGNMGTTATGGAKGILLEGLQMEITAGLTITSKLAEEIRAHGAETYPYECCGALLGREELIEGRKVVREILGLFPLVNRRDDSPRNRFSVTADDVRAAEKAAGAKELEVVGWYHSHPDHPARPSQYDCDHAWPWYSYVIVSVANGKPEDMTSWRLNDDRAEFSCENIELHDGLAAAGKG